MLGLEADVKRSTASEMADEAFRGAIPAGNADRRAHHARFIRKMPRLARIRVCVQRVDARDEETELAVQVQLLQAGVLTVDEVRAMRGLAPLAK